MHVDQIAKKSVKKKEKFSKKLKKCKSKINLKENKRKKIQKSECFSEDEEVFNIMQVRKTMNPAENLREGRECAIFGNFSNQHSNEIENATEIANKVLEKREKNKDPSVIASSSMPIIELRSVNDSSSDISEKKETIMNKLEELKTRMNKAKEIVIKSENELSLNKDIGIHKLIMFINKKFVQDTFFSIKCYEKAYAKKPPQLS